MMMKRWTIVLAGLAAVLCLSSCGAESQEPAPQEEPETAAGEPAEPQEKETAPEPEEASQKEPQEEPEKEPAEAPEENPEESCMALYEEVLDMYRTNIADGWSAVGTDSFDPASASELFWQGGDYTVSDVGYTMTDLDKDGTPELILSFIKDNGEGNEYRGLIADLYTIRNYEVVHVISSFARARYQLAVDHTINYIASNSAFDAEIYNFRLPSQEEVLKLNFGFSWTEYPES